MARIPPLTKAQKEIVRLVRHFNGHFGPLAMEAAMRALSAHPESEWNPIINQLDYLVEKGLIRFTDAGGKPRFFITEDGEWAIKN